MEECKKTKLYVLTGFLGSGKTTVLLELIKKLSGKRIGVIQNEFGKLGIDGAILKNDDIEMMEINRGSIFCSCLKLSFVQALAEMSKKDFDYLFVESSGLGDPSNVDEIMKAVEAIAGDKYEFSGVVCLVDAINFIEQLNDLETVNRQLKHCHLAVITKSDLVNKERIENLKNEIRKINPICKIELSNMGIFDYSFLKEDLMEYQWAESEDTTNSEETKPKTLFMEVYYAVEEEKLIEFLKDVIPELYRVKGFIEIEGKGLCQLDVVGEKIDIKSSRDNKESKVVFISKVGPAVIKSLFSAWEKHIGKKMKLKN